MCYLSHSFGVPLLPGSRSLGSQQQKLDLDKERTVRTQEEMAEEASLLRKLFTS